MLDLKKLREAPDIYKAGVASKSPKAAEMIDQILELDKDRRKWVAEVEALKAERNKANDQIAAAKRSGQPADAILTAMKEASQKIKEFDQRVGEVDSKIASILSNVPNIPHKDVPVAPGATGNKVVKTWGEPKKLDFEGKDHLDLGNALGWISMETGSKITGAGFPVYFGEGARLQRALINFMLDMHTQKHGYKEAWSPAIVNRASMIGTGQVPKMEEDMYSLYEPESEKKHGDFFLIPTAEVPITNFFRDDTLGEEQLPVLMTGYTPCFRREAGTYGKDTRGLSRVHQFDKVELVKIAHPDNSEQELETLLANAEAALQALELPYRVLLLGSGDMSFSAAKCYDLEVWAPVSQKWFEVSSCSLFGDFQARRANIRFRRKENNKIDFCHTLNGSGLALPRIVIALLENFQTAEGKINFPKALSKYLS